MPPKDWNEIRGGIAALLDALVGSTKDTGGSQTTGTVMGKENAILGKINSFVDSSGNGVRTIKSIQHVSITFSPSVFSQTASISPVDVSRSIVLPEVTTRSITKYAYSLSNTELSASYSIDRNTGADMGFWIIEFY